MIKFRVVDTKNRKVLRDSSQWTATVERRNGLGAIVLNDENLQPLLFSGEKTIDEQEIYDGDLIEFEFDGAMTVDSVHLTEDGWVVGSSSIPLATLRVHRVVGSSWEMPWPINRPAIVTD